MKRAIALATGIIAAFQILVAATLGIATHAGSFADLPFDGILAGLASGLIVMGIVIGKIER